MAEEHDAAAAAIIRKLTGGRWTWPPVRVRELYPVRTGVLILRGRPVRSVTSVKRYRDGVDLEYTLFQNGRIELAQPRSCRRDERADVTYEYGSPPPLLLQNAIDALSAELVLAESGSAECRLPEQATSVTRQGVSWTLIDPNNFLDKGRTGIYEIDLAIAAAGAVKKRARVFSPEYPPPERVSTEILPDPAVPAP